MNSDSRKSEVRRRLAEARGWTEFASIASEIDAENAAAWEAAVRRSADALVAEAVERACRRAERDRTGEAYPPIAPELRERVRCVYAGALTPLVAELRRPAMLDRVRAGAVLDERWERALAAAVGGAQ